MPAAPSWTYALQLNRSPAQADVNVDVANTDHYQLSIRRDRPDHTVIEAPSGSRSIAFAQTSRRIAY